MIRWLYIRWMHLRGVHVLAEDCWCKPWKMKVDG